MKSTDRAIMIGFLSVALLVGFYVMVLSPKREEASKVKDENAQLEASITEQEQLATFAQQAKDEFGKYYGRMVVLGKAVPEGADSSSLLVQLNALSQDAGTEFQTLVLAQNSGGASTTAAPAAPAPAAPAEGETTTPPPADSGGAPPAEGVPASSTPSTTGVAAPATETAAASLPVGATVGEAGLPTLPYDMSFYGDFNEVADFVGSVDSMIKLREDSGQVSVDGRLLTVDGFAIEGGAFGTNPILEAQFKMTSYVTPAEQGATLGASPEGPATTTGEPQLTQAASVTP